MTTNSLAAVSLFSGAGGMDVGFEAAGFDVQLANDIDHDACETYRQNHNGRIIHGDLLAHWDAFRPYSGVDLLFGGPPCQGFSVAGKMDPSDSRSVLLESFFDVVKSLQPRAFVCENVKALAQLKKWASVREKVIAKVSPNYLVTMVVLSANDFGVPQKRERVFFIGLRRSSTSLNNKKFKELVNTLLEREKRPARTVQSIVRELGRAGSQLNRRICNARITFAKAPVLRKSPYAGMLFNGAGRPLAGTGYASTLPASMGGNKTPIVDEAEIFDGRPSFVEAYHAKLILGSKPRAGYAPKRLRRLTLDECLRFQTFPHGYELFGRQSSMFRQIGNAVPCDLAKSVGDVVRSLLTISDISELAERKGRLKLVA